MAEFMCMGDIICLYCEDTGGYVNSDKTSIAKSGLFVYTGQDRGCPVGIPNIHAVTFRVVSQNRYKLTKKYKNLLEAHGDYPDDEDLKKALAVAKVAAECERQDNEAEQIRLQGKRVRYGDTIQLRHMFTNKFIHVSTSETSDVDKSKMMVSLESHTSKNALFRILPSYKVKVEGEFIENYDQVTFESAKSAGCYLHASDPYQIDHFTFGSELNLGVDRSSFTWVKHSSPDHDTEGLVRGGHVVRLFHKDIEAFLTAEGVFGEEPTENVHLRVREINPNDPRTLYKPRSGITYWQLEAATSILDGRVLHWDDSVRFRHMTTRRYLYISDDGQVALTTDGCDPRAVFRVYSLSQKPQNMNISCGSDCRIEHVLSGCWLHGPIDDTYERQQCQDEESSDLHALRWDGATLLKVIGSSSRRYPDAYTIQKVAPSDWFNFNYVAGMVPFLKDLTQARKEENVFLNARSTQSIIGTLHELKTFIMEKGTPKKDHQKLLRNLRLVDVMVDLLRSPLHEGLKDFTHFTQVFRSIYEVLHCYVMGRSKKNALYMAKYIVFFFSTLLAKGGVGLQSCQMLIELLRDNRKIVDRITGKQIDDIIGLLREQKHYLYLDLLGVVSVCNGIAMTENQTQISVNLLQKRKDCVYHIEIGQDIGKQTDRLYVSTNNRTTWLTLHTFTYPSNATYSEECYSFLERQLALYKKLCYGRNQVAIEVITRNREFFTWEVAYLGLRSEVLPDRIRATFCDLLIGLFLDVGDNYSIIEVTSNNFVYDEIAVENYGQTEADHVPHDFDSHFPTMRVWLFAFLGENKVFVASNPGRNVLIKEVLRLAICLVKYGFFGASTELHLITSSLVNLINGYNDVPFPPDQGIEYSKALLATVEKWRKTERHAPGPETNAIIEAKLQGLELIELLMIKEYNRCLKFFVSVFKDLEQREKHSRKYRKKLGKLLYKTFDVNRLWKDGRLRGAISAFLDKLKKETRLLDPRLPEILYDLTKYKSDDMITKTLSLVTKYFSTKTFLFRSSARTCVLSSVESVRVHRDALNSMVILLRLSRSKLDKAMANQMTKILHNFQELCHVPHKDHIPHPMGQKILVNNGLLNVLLPLVTQEVDTKLKEQFEISVRVIGSGLGTLRFLAQKNQYVQDYLMDRLGQLLGVQCCGVEQALALQEVFRENPGHCLRLKPQDVQKLVRLAGQYKEQAPQFLQLLKTIMKMATSGTLLKRNQHLVTKFIMEHYKSAAYAMNMNPRDRLQIIIGKKGPDHQIYLVNLVDLLATCAEGENRYIESLCQTLLPVDELLLILSNRHVPVNLKPAFARYLVWAYMVTARSTVESGVDELPHDGGLWKHIQIIWTMVIKINRRQSQTALNGTFGAADRSFARMPLSTSTPVPTEDPSDPSDVIAYMLDGGFLLLKEFFKRFYQPDRFLYPTEIDVLQRLASALPPFTDVAGRYAENNCQLQYMVDCIEVVLRRLQVSKTVLENVFDHTKFNSTLVEMKKDLDSQPQEHKNTEELNLNEKMHHFGRHVAVFLEGRNTMNTQLGVEGNRGRKPYVPEDLEVKFPLGAEFQTEVKCFSATQIGGSRAYKLIDQLEISARKSSHRDRTVNDELDIKSLQILRALIYNITVRLPEDWGDDVKKHKRLLTAVKYVQDMFIDYDVIRKVMPLLDRKNLAVGREVMSLIDLVLFNANKKGQMAMMAYFKESAEEVFFIYIRARVLDAIVAAKEMRSIEAQRNARAKEADARTATKSDVTETSGQTTKPSVFKYDKRALKKKSLKPFFQRKSRNQLLVAESKEIICEEVEIGIVNPAFPTGEEPAESVMQDVCPSHSDVVLSFRVMARLCDGQYKDAQNYFREQPDNLRTVDLVAEMTGFIGSVYTHVAGDTIGLACQVFSTVNELCQGLQENRVVAFNHKIIDYMNFILRMSRFEGCEPCQVIELKQEIGNLLLSLIEENDPAALGLAKEILDTLDICALLKHIRMVHETETGSQIEADLRKTITGTEPTEQADTNTCFSRKPKCSRSLLDSINALGFLLYIILARLFDVDKRLEKRVLTNPLDKRAVRYFRSQCMSVEVMKGGCLQKVHFPVQEQDILSESLRETIKWNIDRTSPSNKLRALVFWTKDILGCIEYQRKLIRNPLLRQMVKRVGFWNYACIILSLVIQGIMLEAWQAPMFFDEIAPNATTLPKEMTSPIPAISWGGYHTAILVTGICHNACSLMLLASYLVIRRPALPDFSALRTKFSKMFERKAENYDDDEKLEEPKRQSQLQTNLLSATTLYFVLLMVLSFAGTFLYAYFFAFHLLNIVYSSELLKGVIRAVTQNGRSLLLVMLMALILIYLYGLIAFAFFRPIFDPSSELYCHSLAKCVLTVIRYGVVGNIADKFQQPEVGKSFRMFLMLTVYQVTFFILFTTIALNVIFGIIVDTFSELRDRKWTAERDMRDTCFICSRDCYDFEQEGHGFRHHVQYDHNMWAYIFYVLHLNDIKSNDYTAVDMHVANLVKQEKLDFFPLNRALCLSQTDEDGDDNKLDHVMSTLNDMKLRQEEEVQHRRRETDRERQIVWQDQYRSGSWTRRPSAPSTQSIPDSVHNDSTA